MTGLLADYGLFLAKTLTVVAAIAALAVLTVSLSRRAPGRGGLVIEKLNDRFRERRLQLAHALLPRAGRRKEEKQEKQRRKLEDKGRVRLGRQKDAAPTTAEGAAPKDAAPKKSDKKPDKK